MEIYYTGSLSYSSEQKEKDKSLGGFKSSTRIPNDLGGNLFGEISMYTLDERLRETKAFIIYNEGNTDLANLSLQTDKLTGSLGKFEIAAVAISPDSDGEVYMESIPNMRGTPFNATFIDAEGPANKQLLTPSFLSREYIGIWIRRTIDGSDKNHLKCDKLFEDFSQDPRVLPVLEGGVDITLSWD